MSTHNICFSEEMRKIFFLRYTSHLELKLKKRKKKKKKIVTFYVHPCEVNTRLLVYSKGEVMTITAFLGNAAGHILIFFYFFPENAIKIMQIVSSAGNLHEMSKPVFWGKKRNRRNCFKISSEIFTQHAKL